jgi:predicted LPLAT superfamily acyltransferase
MAGCPAVVLLSAKTQTHRYAVDLVSVTYPRYEPGLPKREQLSGWVQAFARVLEDYLLRYPYQCFLFYDIWQKPEAKSPTASTGTDAGNPAAGKEPAAFH